MRKWEVIMTNFKRFVHKWVWVILIAFCIIGLFYPVIGIVALICMLSPSIFAFAKGRIWCGNFCPRGSFNDTILAKISRNKKVPQFMKSTWFRTLFLVILMGAFTIQLILAWGDMSQIGTVFVRMIIITTLITIVLGIVYSHRAWCVICPMGTMASSVTKFVTGSHMKYVTFEKEKCVNCKICSKECPIGIDVLSYKQQGQVTNADCLKCNVCINKCPKKALCMK